MKKTIAVLVALVAAALILPPAQANAGSSTDAALALGAFAVFNQIVVGQTIFHHQPRYVVQETVVVPQPPAVIYQPPPVVYAPPPAVIYAPPPPPVFVYPNGYAYAAPYPYGVGYYKPYRKHRRDDDD